MRTRPRICARKRRFADPQAAWAAVVAAARSEGPALRVYRCMLCRQWHLTSRTKGLAVPSAIRAQLLALPAHSPDTDNKQDKAGHSGRRQIAPPVNR